MPAPVAAKVPDTVLALRFNAAESTMLTFLPLLMPTAPVKTFVVFERVMSFPDPAESEVLPPTLTFPAL